MTYAVELPPKGRPEYTKQVSPKVCWTKAVSEARCECHSYSSVSVDIIPFYAFTLVDALTLADVRCDEIQSRKNRYRQTKANEAIRDRASMQTRSYDLKQGVTKLAGTTNWVKLPSNKDIKETRDDARISPKRGPG